MHSVISFDPRNILILSFLHTTRCNIWVNLYFSTHPCISEVCGKIPIHPNIACGGVQERQNKAVTKLQALARCGKRDRRAATVKKQQKQVRGRPAYKSYVSSFTVDNTQKVGGFASLDLLHNFHPQIEHYISCTL